MFASKEKATKSAKNPEYVAFRAWIEDDVTR
jgi:hypothetical protein